MNKWIVTKKLFIYWNLYLHLHLDCGKTSTTKEVEYYYIILNKEKTIKMNWEIIKTAQQEKFHNIFYPCLLFTCYSHHNLTLKQKQIFKSILKSNMWLLWMLKFYIIQQL